MVNHISDLIKKLKLAGQKTQVLQRDRFQRSLLSLNILSERSRVEQHDMALDLTHILEGSGTIEQNGQIKNKSFRSEYEWRGDKLENSVKTKVASGDFLIIPAGVPHTTYPTKNQSLVYLTYKQYLTDYNDSEKISEELKKKIRDVKGIIMDVDGTMTDGKVLVNEKGEESASFSRIDSLALLPWQGTRGKVGIISREDVSIATMRANKLQIDCMQGQRDKLAAARKMVKGWGLSLKEVCFIGDDVNDITLLKTIGLSACPADAQPQVLQIADLVVPAKRGEHVIRKLLDLIFLVQLGKYPDRYERS